MLPLLLALSLGANASGKTLVRTNPGTTVPISGAAGLYVDSVNGNDANSGRSRSAALQTIAALITASPAAGSTVWLARGSTWREELSGLADGIRVRAYGSGARPIFDAADVATNGDFTKTGGWVNVYQITWTHELDAAAKVKHSAWENGTRLTRVADVATCDATPGSFYAPGPDTVGLSDVLYVHPVGSTNPTSDGKTYEFARRKWGVWADAGATLSVVGVHTRRNGHDDGSLKATYASDSICEDGTVHNCWNAGTFEDVVAWKSEGGGGAGSWTMFVHYTNGAGPGATYRRCRAVGSSSGGGVGFYSHTASGEHAHMVYDQCTATNVDTGFGGVNATAFSILDSQTYKVTTAITATAATVLIDGGVYNGWTMGTPLMNRFFSPASTPGTVTIRDVAVVGRTASGAWVWGAPSVALDIQNSTFAFLNHTGFPYTLVQGGTLAFTSRNNVISTAGPTVYNLSGTTTLDADESVHTAGMNYTISGVNHATFAAYQAAVAPQEAATVVDDPEFIGSVQFGDVRVSVGSPARALNAGAQLNSSTVYTQAYWDALATVTP